MRLPSWIVVPVAFLLSVPDPTAGASPLPSDLPAVASRLADLLEGRSVDSPDGVPMPVMASGDRGEGLLTRQRLEASLATVSEAEAWPAAWLVVQRADLEFDLVLRLALDESGNVSDPDFLFTVPRREWQVDDMQRIVREAAGRKPPRKGAANLVIQGFSTKIETTYVYERRPTQEARGLEALLPPGSMIRDAESIGIGEARRTLALVLQNATYVPSACDDCASEIFGHADSGQVTLVVTDQNEVLDRIDLTPHLRGTSGIALVPRYRCGDAARESIPLLKLEDLDGDGRALEFELPAEAIDCERHRELVLQFVPEDSALRILEIREVRTGE